MTTDECTWRPWETGGATYYGLRRVGTMVRGVQDLGHVEETATGWEWRTRAIPGPLGSFDGGESPTESEARKHVERCWSTYLGETD